MRMATAVNEVRPQFRFHNNAYLNVIFFEKSTGEQWGVVRQVGVTNGVAKALLNLLGAIGRCAGDEDVMVWVMVDQFFDEVCSGNGLSHRHGVHPYARFFI